MLKRTLLVAIIALALALVAGTAARQWLNNNQSPLASPLAEIKDILSADFQKEILAPPPLRLPFSENAGQLTSAGILRETNRHRGENNAAPLTGNPALDQAAQTKLNDMFTKQYFDHVSPNGTGPGDIVDAIGYQYIRVGENLALGNFTDDTELVQAWMDSPGHRANILYSGFSQIGIATTRGTYEGQQVWIAVQEFGLPLSACPTPDAAIGNQIAADKEQLTALSAKLTPDQAELDNTKNKLTSLANQATSLASDGNKKVEEGNNKIAQGNDIFQTTGDRDQAQPYWDAGKSLQTEGNKLLDQAQSKQAEYQTTSDEYENQRQNYNRQVDEQHQLNNQLQSLVDQYNQQVSTFNNCLE